GWSCPSVAESPPSACASRVAPSVLPEARDESIRLICPIYALLEQVSEAHGRTSRALRSSGAATYPQSPVPSSAGPTPGSILLAFPHNLWANHHLGCGTYWHWLPRV